MMSPSTSKTTVAGDVTFYPFCFAASASWIKSFAVLVSEYGFLCKPGTVGDYDPLTGVNYRTEIEGAITRQGFFPIDTSILKPFKEGAVTNPATFTDTFYQDVNKTLTAEAGNGPGSATTAGNGIPSGETNVPSDPYGFCLSTNG